MSPEDILAHAPRVLTRAQRKHYYLGARGLVPPEQVGALVRGQPSPWAEHDARPCQIPRDGSGGYTSIFAAQAGEDRAGRERDATMM